jgi:hypothetical protein
MAETPAVAATSRTTAAGRTPTEAAADPQAQRNMREQIERDAASESGGGDDVEVVARVVESGLEAEGEQNDASDHR